MKNAEFVLVREKLTVEYTAHLFARMAAGAMADIHGALSDGDGSSSPPTDDMVGLRAVARVINERLSRQFEKRLVGDDQRLLVLVAGRVRNAVAELLHELKGLGSDDWEAHRLIVAARICELFLEEGYELDLDHVLDAISQKKAVAKEVRLPLDAGFIKSIRGPAMAAEALLGSVLGVGARAIHDNRPEMVGDEALDQAERRALAETYRLRWRYHEN